ncbi:hypothetical protein Riv7116_5765 [Rivularia sp. PCC 7116]|uniref:hypothetical protein n=1 Tax=Rivularia sp. PCC 7116 TaxID=373994 RepID=UPI00029EDF65|nr:hypothetical protein [Rivularia sp. PCC 7116]AFY58131.1 hypothetical protein Riv7116_5765 [Rivularia sp. PCC 7116]
MAEKINNAGVIEKMGKALHDFTGFIFSPWINASLFRKMQRRVEDLENKLYKTSSQTASSQEKMVSSLQRQLDLLEESTSNRLEKIANHEVRHEVSETIQKQIDILTQIIKPTVEILLEELEDKKLHNGGVISLKDIQERQNKLRYSLECIERELTASLPELESQRAGCIEAGRWLLANRIQLAQTVARELLTQEHPHIEEFRRVISKYLKLIGSCMENEIEPRLLYKGVVNHYEPPVEIYLRAFELIKSKYVNNLQKDGVVSAKAVEELKGYLDYLIDYIMNVLV